MKLLITGSTGFIGKNLTSRLLDNNIEIVALVRNSSNISALDTRASIFSYTGDINSLISYCKKEKFDGIIHLASLFLASHNSQDIPKLIQSNIQLGTELLEASKHAKTPWFINTGTFWQHYQNEHYNPVNLYAATKQAFEQIAKYYTETSDLIFTTLKLNDTFGPNDTRNKVFNLWHRLLQNDEMLEMSPGDQIVDISYIDDIVDAYEILIGHLRHTPHLVKNKTFAIHSKERMSLKELAVLFEESVGKKLNIKWGGREYREREVMIPWESTHNLPDWQPKHTLKQAIQKTIGAMQ